MLKTNLPSWSLKCGCLFPGWHLSCNVERFHEFYKLVVDAFLPLFLNEPGSDFHYSSLSVFPSFGLFCGFCLLKLIPFPFPQRLPSSFSFPSWAPWNGYNLCHVCSKETYESWLTLACQTFYKHMAKICLWSPKLQWTFSLV